MLYSSLEALAWFGTLILVVRGLPQAYRSWRQGHSTGLSPAMLWLWFVGSVLMLPYAIGNLDGPVTIVYGSNVLFVGIMVWYKYFPRGKHVDSRRKKKKKEGRRGS